MKVGSNGRIGIALIVLGLTFVFMGVMAFHHVSTNDAVFQKIESLIDDSDLDTETKIEKITEIRDIINDSNSAFFNIILPVIASWVGAIIAFYFTADASNKEREALRHANEKNLEIIQSIGKKPKKYTMKQLLELYDFRKDPITASLKDTLKEVVRKASYHGNVVIVKDKNSKKKEDVLGVLYLPDLQEVIDNNNWSKLEQKRLEDEIDKIKDRITTKTWSTTGIFNYISLDLDTTNHEALSAMKDKKHDEIRGIVFDENKEMYGIVNYQTLIVNDSNS